MERNSFKIIKIIKYHIPLIKSITHLKDGRIAICSDDNNIYIYSIRKNFFFHQDQILKGHTAPIRGFSQIDEHHLVSCSINEIIIWFVSYNSYKIEHKYQTKEDNYFLCVISLTKNRIACVREDKSISIFTSNFPYKLITSLKEKEELTTSLIQLENKEKLVSGLRYKGVINFWNTDTFQCETSVMIKDKENKLILIDEFVKLSNNRLFISSNKSLYIINTNTYQVIQSFVGDYPFHYGFAIIPTRDENILWGTLSCNLFLYGVKTNTLECILDSYCEDENDYINGISLIDYSHFVVGVCTIQRKSALYVFEY